MADGPTEPRAGWNVDGDWWHWRRLKPSDRFTPADFAKSCHAFIQNGRLYCRDAGQAAELDAGRVPSND